MPAQKKVLIKNYLSRCAAMGYVFAYELIEYASRVSTPKARVDTKEISLYT